MKRDASEVIAEMRLTADRVADYGLSGMKGKAVIDGWARELEATLPAAEPADAGRGAVAWITHEDMERISRPSRTAVVVSGGSPLHGDKWIPLYTRPPSEAAAGDGYDPNELLRAARWLIGGLLAGSKAGDGDMVLVERIDQHLASQQAVKP